MRTENRDHAVVLGASMAGLLAARVLAEHYAAVTVVDRDPLPDTLPDTLPNGLPDGSSAEGPTARSEASGTATDAAPRRGVPQARHAHALLSRGQHLLDGFFPGLSAELVAAGAQAGDVLGDVRMHLGGRLLRRTTTGLPFLSLSRALLENRVRARVRAMAPVTFVSERDVVGLAAAAGGARVTGARIAPRAGGSAAEDLDADLVVDATGRGSRAPVWLEQLGFEPPRVERVPIGLGYTTRTYRLPADALDGDLVSLYGPSPEAPRGGALGRLEAGRWMLTLAGVLGDHPPVDPAGFLAFAATLPERDVHDAINTGEPLDDPVAFRFPASVRHHYERLSRFPAGFIVLGDGVCSFNPIYGQGMTVAALEAVALQRHLDRGPALTARAFFRDVARAVDAPWAIATGGDRAFPGVPGGRRFQDRVLQSYLTRLQDAAVHDAALATAFVRVSGMLDAPPALLRPSVAARVARRSWERRAAAAQERQPVA